MLQITSHKITRQGSGLIFMLLLGVFSAVNGQPADSIHKYNSAGEVIIEYEEASQKLRNVSNSLLTDFKTSGIEEAYLDRKDQLNVYLRIGSGNPEGAGISHINDMIVIFERLLKELGAWQTTLTDYSKKIGDLKIEMNEMRSGLELNPDSLTRKERDYYEIRFKPIIQQSDSIEIDVNDKLSDILLLEYRVSKDYERVLNRIEELKNYRRDYWHKILRREKATWSFKPEKINQKNTTQKLSVTVWRILDFFRINKGKTLFLFLITLTTYILFRLIRRLDRKEKSKEEQFTGLYQQSIALSLLVAGMLFPMIFPPTTTLIYDIVLLVSYLPFMYILYRHIEKKLFTHYILFYVFFVVLKIQNVLLAASAFSSIIIIACALIFILTVIRNSIRNIFHVRWSWIQIFNWILAIILVVGVLMVFLQRISFGRILINGAGETIAISMVIIFVAHWLDLFVDFLRKQPHFQNVMVDQSRLNQFWKSWKDRSYIVLLLLFLISAFKNFNMYSWIKEGILSLLETPRMVGEMTFTYGGIVLFFLVIYVSTKLSSVVKFLTEDKSYYVDKKTTASVATMIRFFLICAGFVLALLVSGIPLDRLTIILGALSVGIGFGLQNVVNNLISGLILVMERPIQTGDLVEVQNYTGVVKDIGIRSSIIRTYEGAEVIVPNGNLISQEVINWTLTNKHRRVEVRIGISYENDPEKALKVLQKIMDDHEKILMLPQPVVYFDAFGDSSLNFRMLFWTGDIDNWIQLKSDISIQVYSKLTKEGIEIPFPQRDIHVKSWATEAMPTSPAIDKPQSKKN